MPQVRPALLLLLAVLLAQHRHALCATSPSPPPAPPPRAPRAPPSPLVIAYASWSQCDPSVARAAAHGANVIVWFSITLSSRDGRPHISGAVPDLDCVARTAAALRAAGRRVLHMISVGGWNAALPATAHSGAAHFAAFHAWNVAVAARAAWPGFDGLDWDLEGSDDPAANVFERAHLHLMGDMSVAAKAAGYLVSLAPAQSYLDPAEPRFDLAVTHAPPWRPAFAYHGRNLYAYLLAFYARSDVRGAAVDTFDWVALQLYEGWSRTNHEVAERGVPFASYVQQLVEAMAAGWDVDFGQAGGVRRVAVPRERLVLGFANGWAKPFPPLGKFLFVRPAQIADAWAAARFAGFMFWSIREEGQVVDGRELFLAKELADIARRRQSAALMFHCIQAFII